MLITFPLITEKNTLAFSSLSQCHMYMYYHWLFVCDEALLVWVQINQLVKGLGTVTLVHQFQIIIVDAIRHTDHRKSIGRNFSLKNLANKIREIWGCILEALMKNLHLFITQFFGFDETLNNDESLGLTWIEVFYAVSTIFHPCNGSDY